jgi:hypothetical protein
LDYSLIIEGKELPIWTSGLCINLPPSFHAGHQHAASSKAALRIHHVESFSDFDEVLRETCDYDLLPLGLKEVLYNQLMKMKSKVNP